VVLSYAEKRELHGLVPNVVRLGGERTDDSSFLIKNDTDAKNFRKVLAMRKNVLPVVASDQTGGKLWLRSAQLVSRLPSSDPFMERRTNALIWKRRWHVLRQAT